LDTAQEELDDLKDLLMDYYYKDYDKDGNVEYDYVAKNDSKAYWLRNTYEHPELLDFWFDFLDTEGELQQFNVKNIGSRPKVVNETSINSIYFRETPAVVFTDNLYKQTKINGYRYLQIPE
jgi:hypothetical protein